MTSFEIAKHFITHTRIHIFHISHYSTRVQSACSHRCWCSFSGPPLIWIFLLHLAYCILMLLFHVNPIHTINILCSRYTLILTHHSLHASASSCFYRHPILCLNLFQSSSPHTFCASDPKYCWPTTLVNASVTCFFYPHHIHATIMLHVATLTTHSMLVFHLVSIFTTFIQCFYYFCFYPHHIHSMLHVALILTTLSMLLLHVASILSSPHTFSMLLLHVASIRLSSPHSLHASVTCFYPLLTTYILRFCYMLLLTLYSLNASVTCCFYPHHIHSMLLLHVSTTYILRFCCMLLLTHHSLNGSDPPLSQMLLLLVASILTTFMLRLCYILTTFIHLSSIVLSTLFRWWFGSIWWRFC